jgi:adenylylsulfate kinase
MVIWLVGMSGAGKSVIGRATYAKLKEHDPSTVYVDGDEIREIFRHDRGTEPYTIDGRRRNAERIRELCAWLDRQGINVVCAILSIFEETHEWNRQTYSEYFEVFVDAPVEILVERNPKDLYRRAARGEVGDVVGVQIPFEPPRHPDLVIDNGREMVDPEAAAQLILDRVGTGRR